MTDIADTNQTGPDSVAPPASRLGRNDPLLQELWAIKAALNAEAGYSVEKRAAHARAFDLEATLARLRQPVAH